MALKAKNLGVLGVETRALGAAVVLITKYADEKADELREYSILSAGAVAEMEAKAEAGLPGIGSTNTLVKVIAELFKDSTPFVRKVTKTGDPDVGKFIEVDADMNDAEPRNVVIDPSTL